MFKPPRCSHGIGGLDLLCQAVGTLTRCWQELQQINGRLARLETALSQAGAYPQQTPLNGELVARGIEPLPE